MKNLLFILLLLFSANSTSQIKPDKVKHTVAGAAISTGTYWGSKAIWKDSGVSFRFSIINGMLVGYGKEIYDSFQTKPFSWADFGYTFTSSIISSSLNYGIDKLITKRKANKEKDLEKDYYDLYKTPLVKASTNN